MKCYKPWWNTFWSMKDKKIWPPTSLYKQNTIVKGTKDCRFLFPQKVDLEITKNYIGITEIKKIPWKNQNGFQRNRSTAFQLQTIRWIIKGLCAKNIEVSLLFVDFSRAFDSMHCGKMEETLLAGGLPKETVTVVMILYKSIFPGVM